MSYLVTLLIMPLISSCSAGLHPALWYVCLDKSAHAFNLPSKVGLQCGVAFQQQVSNDSVCVLVLYKCVHGLSAQTDHTAAFLQRSAPNTKTMFQKLPQMMSMQTTPQMPTSLAQCSSFMQATSSSVGTSDVRSEPRAYQNMMTIRPVEALREPYNYLQNTLSLMTLIGQACF